MTAKKLAAKGSATVTKQELAKATARVSVAPVGEKAREIAAAEPVSAKVRKGKTANPLAPERVAAILDALEKAYPKAKCALNHRSAWELLVATILSAQCTDVRVNLATPALFAAFPTPEGDGGRFPARVGSADPHDGFLSQQGEVDQGRSADGDRGVWRRGSAHHGRVAAHSWCRAEDGERGAGLVVWHCGRRGGGYACAADFAAAGADQGD